MKNVTEKEKQEFRRLSEEARERVRMEKKYGTYELKEAVRDKLWSMAWDQGHSSGYAEVEIYYADLAKLVLLVLGG